MSETHKLSLTTAILININIMIGVGVFINTTALAKQAGSFGSHELSGAWFTHVAINIFNIARYLLYIPRWLLCLC